MTRRALLTLSIALVPALGSAESSVTQSTQAVKAAAMKEMAVAKQAAADIWITLKTRLALLTDEGMNGLDVTVSTQHRVVTLRGKVDSDADRQAAEKAARGVEGQKRVIDGLVVVPKRERPVVDREDARIVRDVGSRLKGDANVKDSKIAVRSDGGIVTLTGRASSLETSVHASEDARRVSGVRAVRTALALDSQG